MQRLLPLDDRQAVSAQGKDFDATAETVLANAIVARSSVGHVVAVKKQGQKQSPPGRMEPGGKVNENYLTSMDYFHQPKCIVCIYILYRDSQKQDFRLGVAEVLSYLLAAFPPATARGEILRLWQSCESKLDSEPYSSALNLSFKLFQIL